MSTPVTPVVSDGGKRNGNAGKQPVGNRFEWVSSSPSPATVDALVHQFPEVVQAPLAVLEAESAGWGSKAVIARSMSRWIPPEAIVRELRRAGAAGAIETLCLAHRHYVIQFSDPSAKLMALGNPWAVNGQVVAMEDWKPEFVPSEATLSSALLWIRLPFLPLEFWNEEILSPVLAAAGRFLFLDDATKGRKRGGYARACVQVDLGKPLRPGVRIRGTGEPFWQSFVYEHLEGFCSRCGAFHSGGDCPSLPVMDAGSPSPLFGPWLSAVRRRSTPQVVPVDAALKSQKATVASSPGSSEGWQKPKKPARRISVKTAAGSGLCPTSKMAESGESGGGRSSGIPFDGVGSPSAGEGRKSVLPEAEALFSVPVLAESNSISETSLNVNQSSLSSNPFAKLGSDKWAGRPKSLKEANPGPLKRARPVEPSVPRVGPSSAKGKGKIHAAPKHDMDPSFTFSASSAKPKETSLVIKDAEVPKPLGVCSEASPEHHSHDSVVSLLKKAIQGEVADVDMSVSGPPDTEMTGDRVDPPQPK